MIAGKNFLPIENILSKVKMKLRSFDESGLLDDSALMASADYVLDRTGYSRESNKVTLLDITDKKAELPTDLIYIQSMYRCDPCNSDKKVRKERLYFGNKPLEYTERNLVERFCKEKCEVKETSYTITRSFYIDKEYVEEKFCNKRLLKYNANVKTSKIVPDCPNLSCTSEDYFSIKGNTLHFNFEEGHILLKYTGRQVDEEGYPLIEDDPILLKAIEDAMIVEGLETIYYNGEADVLQRLQLARSEASVSLSEAMLLKKISSHSDIVRYGIAKRKYVRK